MLNGCQNFTNAKTMKDDSKKRGGDKRKTTSKRAVGKGPKSPAAPRTSGRPGFKAKPASRETFDRRDDGSSLDGFENSRRTYASRPEPEAKPQSKGPRAKAKFGPKNPSTGTRMYGRPTEFNQEGNAQGGGYEKKNERGGERPSARKFAPKGDGSERPRREGADRSTSSRPFVNDKSKTKGKSFDNNRGDSTSERPKREGADRSTSSRPFVNDKSKSKSFDNNKGDFAKKPYTKSTETSAENGPKKPYVRPGRGVSKGQEGVIPEYDFKRIKEIEANQNRFRKEKIVSKSPDGAIRLNRYISNAGICSRRDADLLIEQGEIFVNGTAVTELGYKVAPGDVVKYGKRTLSREKMVYLLLNKPKDFITTTKDPEERKTVMQLVSNACKERVYPVGRLDRNTTGLLVLTNDGELAEKLSHPSNQVKKIYEVTLDKAISKEHFDKIASGITLEDGFVKVDEVAMVNGPTVLGVEIHSGKNRIVRRIFESFGYEVIKLDRVLYAGLDKKDLPRGNWRFLTEKEVIQLKYFR